MASLPHSKSVTYEEWLRMPVVSDVIEEVVNGEIRITPPAKLIHAFIVRRLRLSLERQVDEHTVFVLEGVGLVVSKQPLTSRVPDLAVFEASAMVEQDGYIHSPPQLVVEVLSPANTRRERDDKLSDYAALGVPEVWVFSPEARTVEVLMLETGRLRTSALLRSGTLQPAQFPHVHVDIAAIWPD